MTSAVVLLAAGDVALPETDIVVDGVSCSLMSDASPGALSLGAGSPATGREPAAGVAEVTEGPSPPFGWAGEIAPGWIILSVASRETKSGSPRVTFRGVFLRMCSARGPTAGGDHALPERQHRSNSMPDGDKVYDDGSEDAPAGKPRAKPRSSASRGPRNFEFPSAWIHLQSSARALLLPGPASLRFGSFVRMVVRTNP